MTNDSVPAEPSDASVVARVCAGDLAAFVSLMRRYNRRVYRSVRSVLLDEAEAEDAVQETWLAVYRHLGQLESHVAFASWLTRIAVRSALARVGKEHLLESLDVLDEMHQPPDTPAPEDVLHNKQVSTLLEHAMDALPPSYRVTLMLRDIEQMNTAEAAQALGVTEENLRIRLHRARSALREKLLGEFERAQVDAFQFAGVRCAPESPAQFA